MRTRCFEDNGATRGRSVRPKFPSLGRKLKTESELRAAARQALERNGRRMVLHNASRHHGDDLDRIWMAPVSRRRPLSGASCRQDRILTRFAEFLKANPDRPLYLTEICAAIGVAERTLRAACEEHLGMGPIRYLTLRRMHLVRRALLHSHPSTATVTQIVTDHGFWELGRFSVAYRMLFGEQPSETLRRPSWQCTVVSHPRRR
jgi:AraC-like DNA-binding protein